MSKFVITPNGPLRGKVRINGAKNAVLPILCACMLTEKECVISQVPPLVDVLVMIEILKSLGVKVDYDCQKQVAKMKAEKITKSCIDYEMAGRLRASFLVMGALLARKQRGKLPLPGGCKIGTRPIDLHLKGFKALGAKIKQEHGYVTARCRKLTGCHIYLDFPSVGATENIMMAAALAEGTTIIENAATEPEISDLAEFLNKMGAKISDYGTGTIIIKGVKSLKGAKHVVIPDRIEAGTFMAAAAITGGEVTLVNAESEHLGAIISKLTEAGVEVTHSSEGLKVSCKGELSGFDLKTLPFPGFPTDLQAVFMSLDAVSKGMGIITETVFENRFMQATELNRMGADIKTDGRVAVIDGVKRLTGSPVKATDLRAGAALMVAALAAEGDTEIGEIYHIERGYFEFDKRLNGLGAKIQKVEEGEGIKAKAKS